MSLKRSVNPLLHSTGAGAIEDQLRRLPHLKGDQQHVIRHVRRDFRDVRKMTDAAEAINHIPWADEAIHLAVSGRFALWHIVPAVLKLSGVRIDELIIATLGFSKRNISALCEMLDDGQIGRVYLLASHYFKGTSNEIYSHAEKLFADRPNKAHFVSLRNHAKLLLFRLSDHRTITVESSANLRSCKNVETATLIGDPGLHAFHRGWILDLFNSAK